MMSLPLKSIAAKHYILYLLSKDQDDLSFGQKHPLRLIVEIKVSWKRRQRSPWLLPDDPRISMTKTGLDGSQSLPILRPSASIGNVQSNQGGHGCHHHHNLAATGHIQGNVAQKMRLSSI